MEYIALFVLAVIPGAAMTIYFQKKDHIQPEPWSVIMISFLLGALVVIPIGILESYILADSETEGTASSMFLPIFFKNALPEELGKIIIFLIYAYRSKYFDELMDGLVYGAAVAAGFATLENIFYVMSEGFMVGFVRAILSVPMHIMAGAMSGYWIARIRFHKTAWFPALLAGPLAAVLAHTFFNIGMFASTSDHPAWFTLGLLVVVVQLILCVVHIRRGLKDSIGAALTQPIVQEYTARTGKTPHSPGRAWGSLTVLAAMFYMLAVVSAIIGFFFMLGVIGLGIDGELATYDALETIILVMLVLIPTGGAPFFWILARRFR